MHLSKNQRVTETINLIFKVNKPGSNKFINEYYAFLNSSLFIKKPGNNTYKQNDLEDGVTSHNNFNKIYIKMLRVF